MAFRRLFAVIAGAVLTAAVGAHSAGAVPSAATPSTVDAEQSHYPMVLDVDMTPNPSCSQPVRGRVSVYFPPGAAIDARVEWRVRVSGGAERTGQVTLRDTVATAEFEIPFAEVPPSAGVLVDARIVGQGEKAGPFGKAWRGQIGRGCHPVRTVAVGDSVVWGQGLDQDHKFSQITGQRLGAATGRGAQTRDYSISGAVLDAPELPAGNDDSACLREGYRQDPDGDGEMEFGEVTQQTPDVFCQLERAKADALRDGSKIDLVVLNGCINDMDPLFGIPLGITPGTEDVREAVRRECSGIGAAPENPAKDVPYFSGAKLGYGGRGMQAAIEKAHSLPGNPKVIVNDFYYVFGGHGVPPAAIPCDAHGLTSAQREHCRTHVDTAPRRYDQYTRYSAEAYRQAVEAANAKSPDGPYSVAGDGLFTVDNAVLEPQSKLWSSPHADEVAALRTFACPELSETVAQCLTAAVAHPSVAGAAQYAENFLLNPLVRNWFGLGPPQDPRGFTVSRTSGPPGVEVAFDASPAAHRHPGARSYTWYFGDGTKQVTSTPAAAHFYTSVGPNLPRVVVTDAAGNPTLYEAPEPISIMQPSPPGPR